MNITPKDNPEEFNRFLLEKVGLESFENKFLLDYIKKAQNGELNLYNASILNISDDSWLLILHGDVLLIYGKNWKKEQFSEIKKIFNLNSYTNYSLTGNSELINAMIDDFKVNNRTIEKERIFYKTKNINEFEINGTAIELGRMADSKELAEMLKAYYHEEYNGQNDKPIDEMLRRIFVLLHTQSIYVLRNSSSEICSFCTIINPDIGILFTKSKFRGKGFGKRIISYCSKLLLEDNDEVYVMTDKAKTSSNIVCEQVGFKPYFNYTNIVINNG
jgi:predicted GNAT family acetyltransferase